MLGFINLDWPYHPSTMETERELYRHTSAYNNNIQIVYPTDLAKISWSVIKTAGRKNATKQLGLWD